jgi:GNAT superfamily N-acetyltransferase
MAIEIRRARPEEYEEAGRVTALAYREFVPPGDEDWEVYLARIADVAARADRTLVLVAVEDGRVLGTATLELDERIEQEDPPLASHEVEVRMVGVDPAERGRGIGRRLMEASIEEARALGKTELQLHTTSRMRVAQRMYESMGFERGPDRAITEDFTLLSYRLPLREPPRPRALSRSRTQAPGSPRRRRGPRRPR